MVLIINQSPQRIDTILRVEGVRRPVSFEPRSRVVYADAEPTPELKALSKVNVLYKVIQEE